LSRTTRVSRHQKGKTNLDLLEQEIVSDSGISWATCKSASWPSHITTPASHNSVFLQAGCLSCHPTNSVKALKAIVCLHISEILCVFLCDRMQKEIQMWRWLYKTQHFMCWSHKEKEAVNDYQCYFCAANHFWYCCVGGYGNATNIKYWSFSL